MPLRAANAALTWRLGPTASPQLPVRMYSSTFLPSTSNGTLPPSTTVSLNAFRSKREPNAACAFCRCRLISLWPTLYPHAWPGHEQYRSTSLATSNGFDPFSSTKNFTPCSRVQPFACKPVSTTRRQARKASDCRYPSRPTRSVSYAPNSSASCSAYNPQPSEYALKESN